MSNTIDTLFSFFAAAVGIGLVGSATVTQAAPFSQSEGAIIFSGTTPPDGLHQIETAAAPSTSVSLTAGGRNNGTVLSHADWWHLDADANLHWDADYHDSFYTWSAAETEFLITAPGPASIAFSWESILDIGGRDTVGTFGSYSEYEVTDYGSNMSYQEYRYITGYDHDAAGNTFSFDYDFTAADVGSSISIYRIIGIGNWGSGSADFSSADGFADIVTTAMLDVTSLSGGLEQVGAGSFPGQHPQPPPSPPPVVTPPSPDPSVPVPEPATLFLFGCGLIGLAGGLRLKLNL